MKLLLLPSLLLLSHWVIANQFTNPQVPIREAQISTPLLRLHKALIEIESISGNEHEVGKHLVSYLESHNFTVETQDVPAVASDQRPRRNVLAWKGKQRKTRTLLTSHMDVVPPYWPYKREGDEIWGRGSVDAKGSLATQIIAFEELYAAGGISEGDVALLFVVGEEQFGDGMKKANDLGMSWDTVIFGEPTEMKLASGHKGITGLQITAKGKAGHSGYPHLGKNANAMLIPALHALLNVDLPWSEKYGNTTLNIGRVEGGVAANVIAEDAKATIAIRIADGPPEVVQKIVLDTIQKAGEELDVTFTAGYGPVFINSDVEGFETIVVNYGTDIPNLEGDHKRYLYGPGSILLAHSDHEHISVSDLESAVEGYKALIKHSLK
ncbi:Peptidase M20 domain-containing [Hyphodiscus hymeniophilus]|uniref:Peptidase M20 domain-containing n=1 Tax=Hyphodiscus hymeniophilus TaxID=353542 RepID=A0A9P6VMV2_9HELO|nr:Peptidase M20 domain-containing [Hyphodiscus hymeniophilus]